MDMNTQLFTSTHHITQESKTIFTCIFGM